MIRKYLRLAIAAAIVALSVWQFTEVEIGNGIFLTLLAGVPVLFHFRNERILMALWYVRKQDFIKAERHLDGISPGTNTD